MRVNQVMFSLVYFSLNSYCVCIRSCPGNCCIQYTPCGDTNSFTLSTLVMDMPDMAMQDTMCTLDYVGIPGEC